MTPEEKYLFDRNGYRTVPDALSAEELDALNRIWDARLAEHPAPEQHTYRFGNRLSWGAEYRRLIGAPLHGGAAHDDLTDEERKLLEGPNARYRNRPGAL